MTATRKRIEATIQALIKSLGRKCPVIEEKSDLHRDLGLSSDEGVLLVIEIGEEFACDLPDDFNAVVDESGTRGRRLEELVEKVDSFLRKGK